MKIATAVATVFVVALAWLASPTHAECDCGVRWSSPTVSSDTTIYALQIGISAAIQMPSRGEEQSRTHAYAFGPHVDGFLTLPGTWTSPSGVQYTQIVMFSRKLPAAGVAYSTTTYGAFPGSSVRWIDRWRQYRCYDDDYTTDDPTEPMKLDLYYYYFQSGARTDIETYNCPYRLNDGFTCCWKNGSATCPEPISSTDPALADLRFVNQTRQHWQQRGHMLRYAPRASCQLTPTIWDPATSCQYPREGCFDNPCQSTTLDDIICSGRGYCVPTNSSNPAESIYPTDYHCECKRDLTGNTAPFDGSVKWGGRDCAQPLNEDAADELPIACGENMCGPADGMQRPEACSYYQSGTEHGSLCTNDGLDASENLWWNNIEIEAQCDCTGTTWTGDFCTESQCGQACIDNVNINACEEEPMIPGEYFCNCGNDRYGPSCEFTNIETCCDNVSPCEDRKFGTGAADACNGYGDPVNNGTSCQCQCDEGRTGQFCQHISCDASQLNQTLALGMTHASQKASCNLNTGQWTCLGPWNTTRNATGGAPRGLCDQLICDYAYGVNPSDRTKCACASGYGTPVAGDPRCYELCPGNCGESSATACLDGDIGQCVYSSSSLTCSCFCQGVHVNDDEVGCEQYCIAPYATGYATGAGPDTPCSPTGSGLTQCQCTCNSTWTGSRCQTDVNECGTSNWCANGGTCTNLPGTYACQCATGYSGPRCQTVLPVSSSSSSSTGSAASSSSSAGGGGGSGSSSSGVISNSSSSTAASLVGSSGVALNITDDAEEEEETSSAWTGPIAITTYAVGGLASVAGVVYVYMNYCRSALQVAQVAKVGGVVRANEHTALVHETHHRHRGIHGMYDDDDF